MGAHDERKRPRLLLPRPGAAAGHGRERKFGRVVTISSNVGVYGRGGASGIAYAASKAALIAVPNGIAHEGAPHVTANCILPGPTSTDHPNDREEPVEVVEGTEPNVTRTNTLGSGLRCSDDLSNVRVRPGLRALPPRGQQL